MKVFKVTKKIETFEIDEKEFLNRIKEYDCQDDEEIQNAKNINDLVEIFGGINDFDCALEDFYDEEKKKTKIKSIATYGYYTDFDEAYNEYDFGSH